MLSIQHFCLRKDSIAFFEYSNHIFRNKCQFAHYCRLVVLEPLANLDQPFNRQFLGSKMNNPLIVGKSFVREH